MFKLTSSYPPAREEERVGAPAQGPFCRDPVDPVDPLDPVDPVDRLDPLETLAWEKVMFRLSKTMIFSAKDSKTLGVSHLFMLVARRV